MGVDLSFRRKFSVEDFVQTSDERTGNRPHSREKRPPEERSFLDPSRRRVIDVDRRVGLVESLNPAILLPSAVAASRPGAASASVSAIGAASKVGGFYCETCEVLLKDSQSYFDHVNGRKHQHALGHNLKIRHSSLEQVRQRLRLGLKRPANMDVLKGLATLPASSAEEETEEMTAADGDQRVGNGDEDSVQETQEISSVFGFTGFGRQK